MNIYVKISELYKNSPNHLKVAVVAWITRIITSIIGVINIRILISCLGMELYAGFVIITSLSGWFSLFDFGISTSLQNFISEQKAKNESYNNYLNASLILLLIIFFISIILLFAISNKLQLFLFKSITLSNASSKYMVLIIGLIYIITTLCSVAYKVYYAEQKGHLANLYPTYGVIISFIGLIIINNAPSLKSNLTLALIIFTVPPLFSAIYAFYDVFFKKNTISIISIKLNILKSLFRRSYKFAGLAFFAATVLQIDYIVMSRILNPFDITLYNIISKVFFLLYFVYSAILMALWPNCTEFLSQKKWGKANKILKTHIALGTIIIIIGTIAFILTRQIIISILAPGENFIISTSTILLFGVLNILRVWTDTYAVMLQSISQIKIFWIFIPIQGLISFLGQYYCGLHFGINGIVIGLIISFLLTSVWILPKSFNTIAKQ